MLLEILALNSGMKAGVNKFWEKYALPRRVKVLRTRRNLRLDEGTVLIEKPFLLDPEREAELERLGALELVLQMFEDGDYLKNGPREEKA